MAAEEPEIGLDVEFGADKALAVGAAVFGDLDDAVEHQHRRQRQLGVALAEQLAAAAGQKVFIRELRASLAHLGFFPGSALGEPG